LERFPIQNFRGERALYVARLAWATVRNYRSGDNPARWVNHLDTVFTRKKKKDNHQALPYADAPAFMAALRAKDSVSARALEFTILTAARTGETIGAKWNEIDLKNKTWTVPAERMKAGQEHVVPLSDRAVAILKVQTRTSEHVFINKWWRASLV
jgi:integrase